MTTRNQCQFWDCDETIRRDYYLCLSHFTEHQAGEIDQCPACGKYKDAEYDVCLNCYRETASAWASSRSNTGREDNRQVQDEALFEKLRVIRNRLARSNRLREYMVFDNDTLEEMATKRPTTPEAMLTISGVGRVKMERYGNEFLRVICEHSRTDAERRNQEQPTRPGNVRRDNREFAADKDADRFFVYILLLNNGEYYVGQTREIHERLHEHRNNQTLSTKGKEPKLQWFTTVQTRSEAADLEVDLQQRVSNATGRREINRLIVEFKQLSDQLDYTPHQSQAQNTVQERRLPYGGVTPPSRRPSPGRSRRNPTSDVDDLPF